MSGHEQDPVAFWEERYGGTERVWSGRVNAALAAVVAAHIDGSGSTEAPERAGSQGRAARVRRRSLDLGCGEGGDVLWLAERGWDATGLDLSPTAIARARVESGARGVDARFMVADLAEWAERTLGAGAGDRYDLVTASFLQSPVHLPRAAVLRAAARHVTPGGHLVVISHGAPPDASPAGSESGHHHAPGSFPTPDSELADLDLDPASWTVVLAEAQRRDAVTGRGDRVRAIDTVIVARRVGGVTLQEHY
ncbi:class I SAM-dependent methyltransferase [Leucobacter aridicollis]|uniref:SAM-dependent methyltransferase n=1 Tax=Leucobacter aridicollis TaxID=283878 RepID=A0A852RF46_9MICO|nr:class I SAM-dependent methyltransferase [Leucobacter aridicollis]MBL3681010.1 class I SAM-dependent methyltransferase [Leucobacter aridicollis]NYD27986.1 SAM-dependent methyltransferase [Leucobacter aridicollis]